MQSCCTVVRFSTVLNYVDLNFDEDCPLSRITLKLWYILYYIKTEKKTSM